MTFDGPVAAMESTKSLKSFKKPFAVPGKEKDKKDNTGGNTGAEQVELESSELEKQYITENKISYPAEKKGKKVKSGGFTAPVIKTVGREIICEESGNQTTLPGNPERKKTKKKFNVDKSEHEDSVSTSSLCLSKQDNVSVHTSPKNGREKESCRVIKPVRSLTDDEYDKIFECALNRELKSSADVTIQFITSMIKISGSENEGDTAEENLPVNEDNDQDLQDDSESPGLIQIENEITPAVSENEAPNVTKPAFAPVKKKKMKPNTGKKGLTPKHLDLGQIGSKKHQANNKHLKSSIKRKKKVSKQTEMLNRDIEELGTWVQCVNPDCLKWRHIKDVSDPSVLPEQWTCSMNSEELYDSCDKPEEDFDDSIHLETFIYTHFVEGSVVWAKMIGYPWWPAMVEIDPDIGEYFVSEPSNPMLPTHYHVVFFDNKVSRTWVRTNNVKSFTQGNEPFQSVKGVLKSQCYKKEIDAARKNAEEALALSLKERLKKFSFSARFRGTWGHVSDDESPNEENLSPGYANQPLARTQRKCPKAKGLDTTVSGGILLELDLHGTVVDEILDNAESILSNADNLCSMENTFVEPEDDPDFEPQLNKECKKRKSSETMKVRGKILKKKTRKKNPDYKDVKCSGDHVVESREVGVPILLKGAGDAPKSCPKSVEGICIKKRKQKPDDEGIAENIKSECKPGKESNCVLKTKKKKFKVSVAPVHEKSVLIKEEKGHENNSKEDIFEHDVAVPQNDSQLEESQSLLHVKKQANKMVKTDEQISLNVQNIPYGPVKKKKKKHLAPSKTRIYSNANSNVDSIVVDGKQDAAGIVTHPVHPDGNPHVETGGELDLSEDTQLVRLNSSHIQFSTEKKENHKLLTSSQVENSDLFDVDDVFDLPFPCEDQPSSKAQETSDPFEACEE
ncbi:uncharacterized protein LOC135474676 isoform X2 [Liolophura sinensis]|uniref:uncharacterized protein LOC135474676 isoform X2 n=1 Tax=Liolophura sinensis TaxID=3198878 RepID=UPI0031581812